MVERRGLVKANSGRKQSRKDAPGEKKRMGGRRVQKKGVLDVSNPIIPANLDEDIDDDLAFNSDDEAKYGAFFKKDKDTADMDDHFDRLNAVKGGKKQNDDEDFGFSDDSREEFDLSEMLDSKEDRKKAKTTRRNKKEGRRHAPEERMSKDQESILGPTSYDMDDEVSKKATKSAGLHDLLHTAPDLPASRRLQAAMHSKKNLITEDVDEITKERTTREQARDSIAGNLKKYSSILKVHRETPHLKFPLSVPDANPVPGTMGSLVNALQKNQTAEPSGMLDRINDILRASGLGNLRKQTNEAANEGTVKFHNEEEGEDVQDEGDAGQPKEKISVGYMTKLKSMLAYEISKRKRLNKIKSKTYRRILRKEKEREQDRRQKALELLNPEAARARLQAKMEKVRAEERATQKHKNTSKWVKHVKSFAKFDQNTKDALDEQHVLRQRLMEKMDEAADEELAQAADDVSESSEEEMRVDELLAGEKDAESILWQGADKDDAEGDKATPLQKARKELMSMGFMAKAKETSMTQMKKELEDLKEDVDRYHRGQEPLHAPSGMLKKSDKKARSMLELEEEEGLDVEQEDNADIEEQTGNKRSKAKELVSKKSAASVSKQAGRLAVPEQTSHRQREVQLKRRSGIEVAEHDESQEAENNDNDDLHDEVNFESEEKWEESKQSTEKMAPTTAEDEFVGMRGANASSKKTSAKKTTSTKLVIPISSRKRIREDVTPVDETVISASGAMDNAELEAQKHDMQEYLVARAFAVDEVDEDFLKTKEAQVESVMKPVDKNASLPGWGEWGGEDERLNKQHRERMDTMELKRRIQRTTLMKARADAHLENVIINHDVDLVPDRHTLHMIPRPFSNPVEYARSMRQPIGPEWNTSLAHKEGTQPRITTTQGIAIDPMDLTVQKKKAKTIRRKLAQKNKISS